MKHFFRILIILILIISCKDKNNTGKKEGVKTESEIVTAAIEKYSGGFLYKAIVNSEAGLILRDLKGAKITGIPFGEEVLITKFLNFDTILVMNTVEVRGKWVEIVYETEKGSLKGKVFDGYLNYQFNVKELSVSEDTIVVKNEREFFEALSSNRTIIVDAKEINLDKGEEFLANSEYQDDFYGVSYDESWYDEGQGGALVLSDFNNLEVKGKGLVHFITKKSEDDVINFRDCSNIYIDNINFYHKEVPSCEGDVVGFKGCNNFYFQNSHFDGSGLTAINAFESDNLNFLNCDFYNNHRSIVSSEDVGNINMNRCDIYKNELYCFVDSSMKSNDGDKINITDCFIDSNELSLFFNENNNGSICSIDNTLITNNDFSDDMINLSSMNKISIKDSEFINNVSTENKYIIEKGKYTNSEMALENVLFKGNVDFYDFNRKGSVFEKKENVIVKDVYNQKSDSLLTDFNRSYKDGVTYIERSDEDFIYDEESNEFSVNGHILQGLHKLNFSRYNDFYSFKYSESSPNNNYSGLGNVLDGKLDGEWKIQNYNYNDIVVYSNGEIQNHRREIVNSKTKEVRVLEKGTYVNNKRDGVFECFYEDGTMRKKLTFKEGVLSYPREYYFPSGKLRFVRTENKATHYHPYGQVIAEVVYNEVEGVVLNESTFYDVSGQVKEVHVTPGGIMRHYIGGGVSIKYKGVEKDKDKVFYEKRDGFLKFAHYDNSIARYGLSNSSFIHKSLNVKTGVNQYAEFYVDYVDGVEHKGMLYVFNKEHDIVYKAVLENNGHLDLDIYNNNKNIKEWSKQYLYGNKKYRLNGNVNYYSNGYLYRTSMYDKGKQIKEEIVK